MTNREKFERRRLKMSKILKKDDGILYDVFSDAYDALRANNIGPSKSESGARLVLMYLFHLGIDDVTTLPGK